MLSDAIPNSGVEVGVAGTSVGDKRTGASMAGLGIRVGAIAIASGMVVGVGAIPTVGKCGNHDGKTANPIAVPRKRNTDKMPKRNRPTPRNVNHNSKQNVSRG
jgi:hypothetical protein